MVVCPTEYQVSFILLDSLVFAGVAKVSDTVTHEQPLGRPKGWHHLFETALIEGSFLLRWTAGWDIDAITG